MNIFISEYDRYNAFRAALIGVATLNGQAYPEFSSNEDLYRSAVEKGGENLRALHRYLTAYDKWFYFYQHWKVEEEKAGQELGLTPRGSNELNSYIREREEALEGLRQLMVRKTV